MPVQPTTLVRPDEPARAIAFVLLSLCVYTLHDVIIKWLSGAYPVYEIVLVRSLVAMGVLALFARLNGGLASLKPRRPGPHLLRGTAAFFAFTFYYVSLASLPLGEAVALFFSAPLFITALSAPVLGERVGWRRWSAVALGAIGVVILLRPGIGVFDPAAVLPVASALCYAGMQMVARRACTGESGASMAFSAACIYVPLSIAIGLAVGGGTLSGATHPSLAFVQRPWSVPAAIDLAAIGLLGLGFAVGFYALSQAYRLTRASNVAPFEYLAVPLGTLAGYLVWRDVPDLLSVTGAVLIVSSGLYVFHREALRGRPLALRRATGTRPWP